MATALLDFAKEAREKFPPQPNNKKKKKENTYDASDSESENEEQQPQEDEQEPEHPPNEGMCTSILCKQSADNAAI